MKFFASILVATLVLGGAAQANPLPCAIYVDKINSEPSNIVDAGYVVDRAHKGQEGSEESAAIIFDEISVVTPNGPRLDQTADDRMCAVTPEVQLSFSSSNSNTTYTIFIDVVTLSLAKQPPFKNSEILVALDAKAESLSLAHDIRSGERTRSGWVPKEGGNLAGFADSTAKYVVWLDENASPTGMPVAFLCSHSCDTMLKRDWTAGSTQYLGPLNDGAETPAPGEAETTGIEADPLEKAVAEALNAGADVATAEVANTGGSLNVDTKETVSQQAPAGEDKDIPIGPSTNPQPEVDIAALKAEWLDEALSKHVDVSFVDENGTPVPADEVQVERASCSSNGLSLREVLTDLYRWTCLRTPFDSDWEIKNTEVTSEDSTGRLAVVIRLSLRQNPYFTGLTVTLPSQDRFDPDCAFGVTLLGRNGQQVLAKNQTLFSERGRYVIKPNSMDGYAQNNDWRWKDMSLAFTPGPGASNCKPANSQAIVLGRQASLPDLSVDKDGHVRIGNFRVVSSRPTVHVLINNQVGSDSEVSTKLDRAYPWRFEEEILEYLDVFLRKGMQTLSNDKRDFSELLFYYVSDRGQFEEVLALDLNLKSELVSGAKNLIDNMPLRALEYTDDKPAFLLRNLIDNGKLVPDDDLVILFGRSVPHSTTSVCGVSQDVLELGLNLSIFEFARNRGNPALENAIDADTGGEIFQPYPGRIPAFECASSPAAVHWLTQPDGPRNFPGAAAIESATAPFFEALSLEAEQ